MAMNSIIYAHWGISMNSRVVFMQSTDLALCSTNKNMRVRKHTCPLWYHPHELESHERLEPYIPREHTHCSSKIKIILACLVLVIRFRILSSSKEYSGHLQATLTYLCLRVQKLLLLIKRTLTILPPSIGKYGNTYWIIYSYMNSNNW